MKFYGTIWTDPDFIRSRLTPGAYGRQYNNGKKLLWKTWFCQKRWTWICGYYPGRLSSNEAFKPKI